MKGQSPSRRRRAAGAWGAAAALAAGLSLGCSQAGKPNALFSEPTTAGEIDPTRVGTRDDVTQVVPFWSQSPWLRSEDRTVGFRVPVYFVSAQDEKGVFVSGTIYIWVYRLSRDPENRLVREPVYTWEMASKEAMNFRVRKESIMGLYYGFVLGWPPDLELDGSTIDVVIGYKRSDGGLVRSAKRWQVPVSPKLPLASIPRQRPESLPPADDPLAASPGASPAESAPGTTVQQVSPNTVRINLGGSRAPAARPPAPEPNAKRSPPG